ncbi:MAG: hypothetical protein H7Z43_11255 [Clostridia bacterium]|nr:hypothetical protein [Deltaproteobacteria bacterium]
MQSPEEAAAGLHTDVAKGLTADEAAARLIRDGRNVLAGVKWRSTFVVLLQQFRSLTAALLVATAAVAHAARGAPRSAPPRSIGHRSRALRSDRFAWLAALADWALIASAAALPVVVALAWRCLRQRKRSSRHRNILWRTTDAACTYAIQPRSYS